MKQQSRVFEVQGVHMTGSAMQICCEGNLVLDLPVALAQKIGLLHVRQGSKIKLVGELVAFEDGQIFNPSSIESVVL